MEKYKGEVKLSLNDNPEESTSDHTESLCDEQDARDYEVPTIGFRDAVLAKKFGTSPYDIDRYFCFIHIYFFDFMHASLTKLKAEKLKNRSFFEIFIE